eukprot:1283049-Prymnesium_polylepis.1
MYGIFLEILKLRVQLADALRQQIATVQTEVARLTGLVVLRQGLDAGFSCLEARTAGYSMQEVKAAGYVEGLKEARYS